ncbi:hypothetical protein [Acidovorax sp. SRB_24]|uniref:hypothetical protein n=1 Tax=Acidovorax sp. SRB_24 TaxID=1962700 RepID=UPI00145E9D5D|nr:hypothetical protein [Acidovorax sp. SRB_24]
MSKTRELLFEVARARLANRPGAFERFRDDGYGAMATLYELEGPGLGLGLYSGPYFSNHMREALREAEHARMIAFIDKWVARQPAERPLMVEALPPTPAQVQSIACRTAPQQLRSGSLKRASSYTPPAPVVANGANNAPKKARRDLLDPVIEAAQKACGNLYDAPAVWAMLVQMAETGKRPLLGVSDDGIKWQDANDEPQFFKLKNLRDRLRRSSKQAL